MAAHGQHLDLRIHTLTFNILHQESAHPPMQDSSIANGDFQSTSLSGPSQLGIGSFHKDKNKNTSDKRGLAHELLVNVNRECPAYGQALKVDIRSM